MKSSTSNRRVGSTIVFRKFGYFLSINDQIRMVRLNDGDRYLFIPKVLVAWLLISGWSQAGWIRWSTLTTCGLLLLTTATHWRYERLPDRHWPDYARRIEAGERVEGIRVNPGMTFSHPGRHRK
jgi:hypothetical protein